MTYRGVSVFHHKDVKSLLQAPEPGSLPVFLPATTAGATIRPMLCTLERELGLLLITQPKWSYSFKTGNKNLFRSACLI